MLDALATVLRARCGDLLWLNLGPEDYDPAMLLSSLCGAAQRLAPGVGGASLALLRRYSGRLPDWPPIFRALANELVEALPPGCALVLEHVDRLSDAGPTMSLLAEHLLPALAGRHPCVLIAVRALPHALLPQALRHNANALRLAPDDLFTLADAAGASLPGGVLRRALSLLDGQADSLYSLIRVVAQLGVSPIIRLVDRAVSANDLLARSAQLRLEVEGPEARQALALSMRLGYYHPNLGSASGQHAALAAAWLLPLADDWARLRYPWHNALPRALPSSDAPTTAGLMRVADQLAQGGMIAAAVPLYLDLGAHPQAAALIGVSLEALMSQGQRHTLSGWLAQLPAPVLQSWPWLLYAQGELAAGARNHSRARHSFAAAATSFAVRNDAEGVCQSLLAEGTLALWQGDQHLACERTLAALAHAETNRLAWHMAWAVWQLVGLTLTDGDLKSAMIYLDRALSASSSAGESAMTELLRTLEALLVRQRELGERREFYRQTYFAIERAERELSERLRRFIAAPLEGERRLSESHAWASTPLLLKLAWPDPAERTEEYERGGLWQSVARALGLLRPGAPLTPAPTPPHGTALLADGAGYDLPELPPFAPPAEQLALAQGGVLVERLVTSTSSAVAARTALAAPTTAVLEPVAPARLALSAQLLGPFRVSLGDSAVESWPSGRGRSLFKYLLIHRDRPTSRDVLIDQFWPEALPEDGRNSLNVAMHGLRQAIRAFTDMPVVSYRRDHAAYRLNPELQIWLDVDEFEQHVRAGHSYEAEHQFAPAVVSYEQATSLYQGDFMADDPYDEWPTLRREQLRLAYLDTLDRLGQIYFSQGQYAACANLCRLILARDSCREDAHCRLMRCYHRQGQLHLALRQYQICTRVLADELGVEPLPSTAQLAERIRRREHV